MKKLALATFTASTLVLSSGVSAAEMFLDIGDNSADTLRENAATGVFSDADTQTGTFTEFGFSQLLATSIYDFSDGDVLGDFVDTNIAANLAAAGVPASGTALDGVTTVNLVSPNCAGGQCDIDALSPLVPPLDSDNEGFLQTWDMQVEYNFEGTLLASGPVYTGGSFNVFFNDRTVGNLLSINDGELLFSGDLVGSSISAANLLLFFDITFARDDFLWIKSGGQFVDAADSNLLDTGPTLVLDTNVNPPIPTADQLLLVGSNAIRQTTLDGSITAAIPEPGTLALMGLGLIGLGGALRRKA